MRTAAAGRRSEGLDRGNESARRRPRVRSAPPSTLKSLTGGCLRDQGPACFTEGVMRPANRFVALALLVIAVLWSPAGVCLLESVVATAHAAAPSHATAHAHSCCKAAKGTVLVAGDAPCCSMPRTGFVNVLRFTLQPQAPLLAVALGLAPPPPLRVAAFHAVTIRPPLVLRI